MRNNIDDMWNNNRKKLKEELFNEMIKEASSNKTFKKFIEVFNDNCIELINGTVGVYSTIKSDKEVKHYVLYFAEGIEYKEYIGSTIEGISSPTPYCSHFRNIGLIENPESSDWVIDWFYEIIENKKAELEKKRKNSKKLRGEISKNKLVKSEEEYR